MLTRKEYKENGLHVEPLIDDIYKLRNEFSMKYRISKEKMDELLSKKPPETFFLWPICHVKDGDEKLAEEFKKPYPDGMNGFKMEKVLVYVPDAITGEGFPGVQLVSHKVLEKPKIINKKQAFLVISIIVLTLICVNLWNK